MIRARSLVLAGFFVRYPLGGYVWQTLHHLVGFRKLGWQVFFYEDNLHYSPAYDPRTRAFGDDYAYGCARLAEVLARFDLADRWTFWDAWRDVHHGRSASETRQMFESADVFVNLSGVNRLGDRPRPPATIYVDIDPAYTQIRLDAGDEDLRRLLAEHDLHFTYGENVGTPRSPLPSGGFSWRPTRPPVVTELWEDGAASGGPITTIGQWSFRSRDLEFRGRRYGWTKREPWERFLDLPIRTGERFELAMDVASVPGDIERLARAGWQVRDPVEVSIDWLRYRDYVCSSKAEFSVAKEMNVALRSGWFSDRSACYLAAGRAVVLEDTGFSDVVPVGAGLHAIRDVEGAAEAIARIRTDERAESHAARTVAHESFEAERVLGAMLEPVAV